MKINLSISINRVTLPLIASRIARIATGRRSGRRSREHRRSCRSRTRAAQSRESLVRTARSQ